MITIAHPPFFFRLFVRINKLNFSFLFHMKNHLQINSFLFKQQIKVAALFYEPLKCALVVKLAKNMEMNSRLNFMSAQ